MENKSLTKLIEKYKLSEEEHNKVLEMLKSKLFINKTPEEKPSILFVVGQPGCGKTTYIKSIDLSRYTVINSDAYRALSKYSLEILEKFPTDYAKLTNFDVHLWGDELFLFAVENNYSVLREKAPINNSLLEVIKEIPSCYRVIVNVVVTGNLSSLLATRERYEKEILEIKHAKLSNIDSHNKCYDLLPDFISNCLSLGAEVSYIVPMNQQFQSISVSSDPLSLLEDLRKESNGQAHFEYPIRIENIKRSMESRGAPKEQFDELAKIEDYYFQIANCGGKDKTLKK